MRAVEVRELTGPAGLAVAERPEPPGDGRVVIEVHAAGVSFADLLMSQGLYQTRNPLPFVAGMEAAGVVRSAPPASGLAPGERVCASSIGAFAEVLAVEPERVFALPEPLTFEQGAALTVNYQTAMFALAERARFAAGESALVLGAAGGTGTAAIQVLRGLGASRIVGLVSTEEKASIARDAGADEALLIADDWKETARAANGGVGFDLVYDPVGGDLFLDGVRSLAPGGRLVVIGFVGGVIPEIRVNRLLLNNVGLIGAAWGEGTRTDPGMPRRIHSLLVPLIESGAVAPPVGTVLPMERAADAYRLLAERRSVGKLVLAVR